MNTIITEVYISLDGLEFNKVNLHADESIPMRYTTKDLQNINKIFSPYSLSFTFPADSKNRRIFGFFGDTDVIKINKDSKFITKIYTDSNINLQGFIQLEDIDYKNGRPTNFTGSFTTSMTNLKDRIGDDLISDLPESSFLIDWTPKNVRSLVSSQWSEIIDGVVIRYFVPLISNNRVLSYDSNTESPLKDNVAYDSLISPDSENIIKSSELRPCISYSTILDLIKLKYNLDIVSPIESTKEYKEAVLWCNSETFYTPTESRMPIQSNFGSLKYYDSRNEGGIPDPKKYTQSTDLINNTFKVIRRDPPKDTDGNYTKFFTLQIVLQNIILTAGANDAKVSFKVFRKGTDELLLSKQYDYNIDRNLFECDLQISDDLFINNEIEFYITASFKQPTIWTNCYYAVIFRYYDGKTGILNRKEYATYIYESRVNNNSEEIGGTKIDLFTSLPEIKVADFLTSHFKTFNISVFDTSPTDDRLYWLTPQDVDTDLLVYSKATIDYTRYLDAKQFKKEIPSKYNYYDFKHVTSKYRSNVDYLAAQGLEYGQVKYPLIKPDKPISFTVETGFTLMVPVLLSGSNDIITYYGFDDSPPDILETGESRYTPNYGEITIFYNRGSVNTNNVLGIQSTNAAGQLINTPLDSYIKVLPINSENKTLAFSVLKELGVEYPESLYKRYYKKQTDRLLDPNVLSQDFSLTLPPDEIYLNEATTIQGSGATPKGFRLQNDIILGEDLFSILDATIDQTTGKTKITLLNY